MLLLSYPVSEVPKNVPYNTENIPGKEDIILQHVTSDCSTLGVPPPKISKIVAASLGGWEEALVPLEFRQATCER